MSDDECPPLEDMSEQISAARQKKRSTSSFGEQGGSSVDKGLYESVITDATADAASQRPLEAGATVKVSGLVAAAQYNGKQGTILAAAGEDGRYSVRLEGGKELKVKRANLEEVHKFGAGIAGGFLGKTGGGAGGAAKRDGGPEILKPSGKKEGAMDGLKSVGINGGGADVPEWMKPSADLLNKVNADEELASAVDNQRILKAVDEVSKNPEAWHKYKDDPEISSYFMKMMGMFGKQYEEHEAKQGAAPAGGGGKAPSDASPIEEILTKGARETKKKTMMEETSSSGAAQAKRAAMQTYKKTMIEEISTSGAAQAKRQEMAKPKEAVRKGTTDYSKWANLDPDEEEASKTVKLAPGMEVPKVAPDDPRVVAAMQDPKVQRVLHALRTSADHTVIEEAMQDQDLTARLQLLMAAGVIDIRRPQ